MSAESETLPPPRDPNLFESFCLDLWKEIWQDPRAQKNGRSGQPQAGVDVFGQNKGNWVGIQCKKKDDLLWSKATVKELEAEVQNAREFKPPLSEFILATTGPRDAKVQERARQLTDEHRRKGLFKVSIFSWAEIWKELCDHPKLLQELGPRYWPALWEAFARDFAAGDSRLHQLTPPVSDFTGREAKLDELRKKVKQGGVAITGVRGMGGVGKTELARRLAAELKADYPDAQFELDLKGVSPQPLSPADVLSAILRVFHPTAKLLEHAEELAMLLRQTLDGHHALLVLDNAKDARQIAPFLPPPPGCLILVTSRQHFALPGLDAVNLGVMEPPEARALLLRIAPRVGPKADTLAEVCGRLPLALRLAASFLAVNEHIAPGDYVRQLRDSRQRLQLLDKARELTGEDLGLEASFTLSFQQLPPEHQQRFAQLAVFPQSFDRAAVTAVWAVEESAAGDALERLLHLSLLEWNLETQRFQLHDLLREFARNRSKTEELDAAKRRHAKHFIGVGQETEKLYMKGGEDVLAGLALFDRERGHLEAAFAWLESRGNQESALPLISLVDAVACTSSLRFHARQRIRWLEAQAKAARLAGDRWGEGTASGNLGVAYLDLGDAGKALECFEQCLKLFREIGDPCRQGSALGNLGNAYAALGDTRKAIEFYKQHLAIARQIGDRRGEGAAIGNLGGEYFHLGDTRKAVECFEQCMVINREIGDGHGEGAALLNLGNAYLALGDTRKAIESYEQPLVMARQIGDRRGERSALGNLGCAYAALGDTRKAIDFHAQALVISREIGDRSAEDNALRNLGSAYDALGDARKAIGFLDQALVISREIGNRRQEGDALGALGIAFLNLGDARKAIEFYEQGLAIAREIGDRRGEGNALGNLGNAYHILKEAHKANEFHAQALVIAREIGDRRGEATHLWNSALTLEKLGDRAQAIARAEAALRIREAIEDPNAAKVRATLAKWRKAGPGS